ncbi:MGMT family protein [Pleionea litopenaei]|uniref:MGMT family protein n=1 Tax=Pleionea litopenaei TaxID=3070815 RepID=A0AA51RS68_9GAMM|nr:MGMT family protein [Pleionea sp. HL-JVS1]WMS86509.1 MGMT family protein [Pleionea sp. HL-JVS1]
MDKPQKIISVVKLIPKGSVASYGQVADLAGLPRRARLVGKVLREADDSSLPWHRVLRANGTIAFEAQSEQGQHQTARLNQEGIVVVSNKVDLKKYQWQPSLTEILLQLNY